MLPFETILGLIAAFCTTVSYLPQVEKTWRTGSTGDLSFKMLSFLGTGLTLWLIYGLLRGDTVIVIANAASLGMVAVLAVLKSRERQHDKAETTTS